MLGLRDNETKITLCSYHLLICAWSSLESEFQKHVVASEQKGWKKASGMRTA